MLAVMKRQCLRRDDGFERVAKAEIVWRVEGLPDALALYTRLPPNHAVISSACGAKLSAGLRSELAFLAGKTVFIVGDADIPGQDGAAGVANDVVAVAARVKLGELPYQVEENHGRDIRDFFNDGHTFDELRAILEAADEFQPEGEHLVAASNVTTPGWRVTTPAPAAVTPSNKEVTILPPGTLVRAGDRNNIGTVITDDGGDTVEVEFVSKEGQHATKRLPRELLRFANGSSVTPNDFQLNLLTTDEFLASDFRQHFLIKKVLVEGQCCVLGGPKKVLKTSLLVDLAISLATATPFLGHPEFAVPDVVPVMLLSGESGGFTLKETAKRIALARGWILASAPIFWGFNLPQLSNGDHLEKLARQIKAHGIKVTIIDPAYLCLLSDGMSASATSNVFAMGPLLSGVSDVGRETGCTIIIAHHTRKADRQGPQFGVLDLEDLSGSGFSEWARQWILINRRELYQSDGKHTLWAAIGGSAGHSGTYVVDIDEGVLADDFSGRIWDVVVAKGADVIQRKQEAKERASQEKEAQQTKRIIEVLADANEPLAKTTIRDKANLNSKVLNLALDDLIKRGIVESAEYHDRKSRKQAGFKLSENRDSGIVDSRKSTIESFIRHQRGDDGGFCSPPLGGTIIHNLTVMPTSESQPKQTGGENPLSPNPPALDLADTEEF